jgi:vitamin K-dependent gamma-carboxylase
VALPLQRVRAALAAPVDAASLVAFRVGYGAAMLFATVRFWQKGWITDHYVDKAHTFSYWGFAWVRPLSGDLMHGVFALQLVLAAAILVGAGTRVAAALFTLAFTFVHLCDVTHYLNHYYLVSLLGLLVALLPTGRFGSVDALLARGRRAEPPARAVPAWMIWLVRFQVGVVYFFGGVGKLNADWLVHAEPLATWLARSTDVPLLGAVAHERWLAFAMSWSGVVFDLAAPFLLSIRRTRPFAYAAACAFHLITARLFQLGMFPWLMMTFALVFFEPTWPVDAARRLGIAAPPADLARAEPSSPSGGRALLLAIFVAVQLLVPLRGLLYPGNGLWTEQGFRFAWKVMLVEKNGSVEARVTDKATGRTSIVSPRELYDPYQERMMSTQPDLLLQFAHAVRDRERARGRDVEVRLDALVAMNGRRSQPFVDPSVDLARESDGWGPKRWILPLTTDIAR